MRDGFEEVTSLDADTTVTIGGVDKKTGKNNPAEIEGYYLGAKQVPSTMSKSGFTPLHILLTSDGNVGVWGKSSLNRLLANVTAGQYVAIEFAGMKKIKNFPPMYNYRVGVRKGDTIDVSSLNTASEATGSGGDDFTESDLFGDDDSNAITEVETPVFPTKIARPAAAPPTASAQAKARALLGAASRKS